MERKLPVYEIDGTVYEVDVANSRLVEAGRPESVLSFLEHMYYDQSEYHLLFNRETRRAELDLGENEEKVLTMKIPQMKTLDPEGMAMRVGLPVEVVRRSNDFELLVPQESLRVRMAGALPTLSIGNDKFLIDVGRLELRHIPGTPGVPATEPASLPIKLSTLGATSSGELQFFYDPGKKEAFVVNHDLLSLPEGLLHVTIPDIEKLDPYYFARSPDVDFVNYLLRYPPRGDLAAMVKPAAETGLAEMVRENRQRLGNGDGATDQRPRQRPR